MKTKHDFVPPERLREIAELAEFIADEHWTDDGIEPLQIAKAKGISVSFNDYRDAFDGLLEHRAGRFHIYGNLNRLDRPDSPRARFTLGHELGHYFIDDHRHALEGGHVPSHKSRCDYESKNPVEREADNFASNLLLPERRFKKAAARMCPGLGGILALAEQFRTSITSTAVRYVSLNIKPTAIIKWHDGVLAWKWLSGSTREAGFRSTIDQPEKLAAGCATARALVGETISAPFFTNGTTAAAWFPWVGHSSPKNVIFLEEAIALGRFGVLTLLRPQAGEFDFNNPL